MDNFNIYYNYGQPVSKEFRIHKYKNWNSDPKYDFIIGEDIRIMNHMLRIPELSASINDKQLFKCDPYTVSGELTLLRDKLLRAKKTSLNTLMKDRCNEIANLDKPIWIMCSGGIDSTALTLAFIGMNIPVNVLMNEHIKYENPNFPEFLKKNNVHYEIADFEKFLSILFSVIDESVIVTGGGGCQISGYSTVMYHPLLSTIDQPEKQSAKEIINRLYGYVPYWVNLLESNFDKNTYIEIGWLTNLIFRWNWTLVWDTLDLAYMSKIYSCPHEWTTKDVIPFYGTQKFREFGYKYFENHSLLEEGYNTKKFLKEYIHDRYKDEDYFKTKVKMDSGYLPYFVHYLARVYKNGKINIMPLE